MERSYLVLPFIFALGISHAYAGVVMAPPDEKEAPSSDEYPHSRFGSKPASMQFGVDRDYAARAVIDMETDRLDAASSRSPASLQYASSSGSNESVSVRAPSRPPEMDPAPPSNSEMVRKGVQEVAVIAGDLGFFPKTLFVSRDVPVRMFVTSASKNTLCIMMDSFQVKKQVRANKIEEITFTPGSPGKYRFYCPVNGMEGTLVVKELASTEN